MNTFKSHSKAAAVVSAAAALASVAVATSSASAAPALAPATPASNAYITQPQMNYSHTATASYTGHWSGTGTYNGSMNYGDGTTDNFAQASLQRTFSHGSPYPCSSTTYTQRLDVRNSEGSTYALSQTTWQGGVPC